MSILLGAAQLRGAPLAERLVSDLVVLLPSGGWSVRKWTDGSTLVLQASAHLTGDAEWHESEAAVATVAGRFMPTPRTAEPLKQFAEAAVAGRAAAWLRSANGTFAAAVSDKQRRTLLLASDAIGGRPLYWFRHADCLLFSTSSTLLRRVPGIALRPDATALAELQALAYPMGERTLWAGLQVLRENTLLTVREGDVQMSAYFDWQSVAQQPVSDIETLAMEAAERVRLAVTDRIDPSSVEEVSLLSGGLDSRVIVSELRGAGRPVRAVTIDRARTQDTEYAARYAEQLGIRLDRVPWQPTFSGVAPGDTSARMLGAAVAAAGARTVWSGDGGGETLGVLLLSEATWDALAAGDVARAVALHAKQYAPPRRLLHDHVRQTMTGVPQHRLQQELELLPLLPRDRAMQLALLRNDLRCHLHEYYDRIGEIGVELILPFYDRRIIDVVLRLPDPMGPWLHHRFYARVLAQLRPDVSAVPWQSYPGRPASPIPPDDSLPDQWQAAPLAFGDALARIVSRRLRAGALAPEVKRTTVLLALGLHRCARRDMASVFAQALLASELHEPEVPMRFRR